MRLSRIAIDGFGFANQADLEKAWLPNTLNMFKGKDGKLYGDLPVEEEHWDGARIREYVDSSASQVKR